MAGEADRPRAVAAVAASGPEWNGAALFVDRGDGQLWPLGPAPRGRAVVGTTLDALPPASPLLLDRSSSVTIALASADQALSSVTLPALVQGANLALVGTELIQFSQATALGGGRWRLSHFLRGCAGTEAASTIHKPGEAFALADARVTPIDHAALGSAEAATILAMGRGDAEPVASPVLLAGQSGRPLAPVHARATWLPDGSLQLAWTRRARGGWHWRDGVDVPLAEEAERYLVTFQDPDEPSSGQVRGWTVDSPGFALSAAEVAGLALHAPAGRFDVRHQGTHALSPPLFLARLADLRMIRSVP
jgi:hypothetical protein